MDFLVRKCRTKRQPDSFGEQQDQQGLQVEFDDLDSRHLAKKAGFVSIQDRVSCLTERQAQENRSGTRPDSIQRAPQFANLYELFSSRYNKSHNISDGVQGESSSLFNEPKKTKIPVMKLSKDDWNVRCWEERLTSHRLRMQESSRGGVSSVKRDQSKGPSKIERRTQVFKGRIDDVAAKLDKVREGLPQDDKLFRLSTNRCKEVRNTHEWTDMLKEELHKGTHNPRQLRSELALIGDSASGQSQRTPNSVRTRRIDRPIRRLFQDDLDELIDGQRGGGVAANTSEPTGRSNIVDKEELPRAPSDQCPQITIDDSADQM